MVIQLHQLKFHAYHGVYREEQISGNEFQLDIDVEINLGQRVTDLASTLDYVSIYEVVQQRMLVPTALLETLVYDLAEAIHQKDDRIQSVNISIKKINPPIKNFNGTVGVTYKKVFS